GNHWIADDLGPVSQGELSCEHGGLADRALFEDLAQVLSLGGRELAHSHVIDLRDAQRNWIHVDNSVMWSGLLRRLDFPAYCRLFNHITVTAFATSLSVRRRRYEADLFLEAQWHPAGRRPVDTFEQSVQLATVKVLDRRLACAALKRYVEDTLELRHALRALHGQETREGMQCCQARIACGDAVVPLALEGHQETLNPSGGDLGEFQGLDASTCVASQEPQEEYQGIAVAAYCVGTHAAQPGQELLEEALNQLGQVR